jgi:hypothetical protein
MRLDVTLETMIVRTSRPYLSESRDTFGGCDQASLKMQLEAVIVRTWRQSSVFRDTPGSHDRVSLEIQTNIVIKRGWRYT